MDYVATFIAASVDCPREGQPPTKAGSVAETQYRMLVLEPYRHTQEDVLFASSGPVRAGKPADRAAFFARPQACLRCSPLVKTHGWGIHFDEHGRAAAYAANTDEYRKLAADARLTQTQGMRSRRAVA
jgi:hypothetical protein